MCSSDLIKLSKKFDEQQAQLRGYEKELKEFAGKREFYITVLRIAAGYMFMLHGSAKLLGLPHVEMFDDLQLFSLYGVAGMLELGGGLLVLLGLFTRLAAFILSGQMAAAYFIGHVAGNGHALIPFMNGGEAAALFRDYFKHHE